MKILLWNILDGGENRLRDICSWIARQEPNAAALCECNAWPAPDLQRQVLKHSGATDLRILDPGPSAYRPGLLAWTPIEIIAQLADPMCHGLLHARIIIDTIPLHLLITHWAPRDAEHRRREADLCADYLGAINEPALLLGDLNSHSPADDDDLRTRDLAHWTADYRPHHTLLRAGLIDLSADPPGRFSTATSLKPDEPRRRIDFAYANSDFSRRWPAVRSRIIHDPAIAAHSDHWPLIIE